MVHQNTKFSTSSYNSWGAEIAGVKKYFGNRGPDPLGNLTPKNLPIVQMCYCAKFSGSAAMSPMVKLSIGNHALQDGLP